MNNRSEVIICTSINKSGRHGRKAKKFKVGEYAGTFRLVHEFDHLS